MKKKVVAMFLAAVMALSLVACGSKSDNGGSGDASGTETIKLGGVGPLTGGYANYGLSVQHGAELAVKEINAAGGVNGKQLEVNFQDSQGDPESAVAAYGKLMDWGMNVCLGGVLSGETASVVAAAKVDDMFIMETTGSADKCIDGNDKAFRICFYDSYQGTAAADYLTDNALATGVLSERQRLLCGSVQCLRGRVPEHRRDHQGDADLHHRHQHRLLHPGERPCFLRREGRVHPHLRGGGLHLPDPGQG